MINNTLDTELQVLSCWVLGVAESKSVNKKNTIKQTNKSAVCNSWKVLTKPLGKVQEWDLVEHKA